MNTQERETLLDELLLLRAASVVLSWLTTRSSRSPRLTVVVHHRGFQQFKASSKRLVPLARRCRCTGGRGDRLPCSVVRVDAPDGILLQVRDRDRRGRDTEEVGGEGLECRSPASTAQAEAGIYVTGQNILRLNAAAAFLVALCIGAGQHSRRLASFGATLPER